MPSTQSPEPPPAVTAPHTPAAGPHGNAWQPLPQRARGLLMLSTGVPLALLGAVAGTVLARAGDGSSPWLAAPLLAGLAGSAGAWWGAKYFRNTAWRLDAQGLGLRRGRLWHSETRVPATRVQHLDIKHGPLQRRRDLATLVVHTAGTANSAVSIHNLDVHDAERLRDTLSRQIETDGDA